MGEAAAIGLMLLASGILGGYATLIVWLILHKNDKEEHSTRTLGYILAAHPGLVVILASIILYEKAIKKFQRSLR